MSCIGQQSCGGKVERQRWVRAGQLILSVALSKLTKVSRRFIEPEHGKASATESQCNRNKHSKWSSLADSDATTRSFQAIKLSIPPTRVERQGQQDIPFLPDDKDRLLKAERYKAAFGTPLQRGGLELCARCRTAEEESSKYIDQ